MARVHLGNHVMNLLFLGAGKRFTLIEQFFDAAYQEGITLKVFSIEDSHLVPIAQLASIIIGPRFSDPLFFDFLIQTVKSRGIDLVIPNMDAATVVLAKAKKQLSEFGCHAVVSNLNLCEVMVDKVLAEQWFIAHNISVPKRSGFPFIIKSRKGFGSRDQASVENQRAFDAFFYGKDAQDYIVQDFVNGQEYTVDAYVDRTGAMIAALSRKRLKVVDGEVDISETHHHPGILALTSRILSISGWEGPITLQFIDDGTSITLIEINPRFGGGVTHSIHAGLDFPRWIIREQLRLPINSPKEWRDGSIMVRYRKDTFL